jgi:hypothetical protein
MCCWDFVCYPSVPYDRVRTAKRMEHQNKLDIICTSARHDVAMFPGSILFSTLLHVPSDLPRRIVPRRNTLTTKRATQVKEVESKTHSADTGDG